MSAKCPYCGDMCGSVEVEHNGEKFDQHICRKCNAKELAPWDEIPDEYLAGWTRENADSIVFEDEEE